MSNLKTLENSTLALAGIFQAVDLVKQTARHGRCDENAFVTSLSSLFKINPSSTLAVYGELSGLHRGLSLLGAQLGFDAKQRDQEVLRYLIEIIFMERRLNKNENMQQSIREGIERAAQQAASFDAYTHPNVIANLSGIYSDTISTFKHRIHVHGDPVHLQNPANVNKVRTLLLAALRSAVLWRQTGGGRLQLLWSRRKIIRCAEDYLKAVEV